MRKKIHLLYCTLVVCITMQAGVVSNEKGKLGYMDESGNLIMDYQYDFIGEFSGTGVTMVKKGKFFGLANRSGEVILPIAYDMIMKRSDGKYLLMLKEKFGLAAPNGRLLFEPVYLHIFPFNSDGIAIALVKQENKEKLLGPENTVALITENGKELIRESAVWLEQVNGDWEYKLTKSTDKLHDPESYTEQLNREQHKTSISLLKKDTIDTSSGYFAVGYQHAFYDLEGKPLFNRSIRETVLRKVFGPSGSSSAFHPELKMIESNPHDDIIAFKYNQKIDDKKAIMSAGYYNLKTQTVIFYRNYKVHRYVGKSGKVLYLPDMMSVENRNFHDGFAIVRITGSNQQNGDLVINKDGLIARIFGNKTCCDYHNGYMVAFGNNGKVGLWNTKQEQIFEPQFAAAKMEVNAKGMWAVKNDSAKWGVLSPSGDTIVPFKYDNIIQMRYRDVFFVRNGRFRWGAYEREKMILTCNYDTLFDFIGNSFIYRKWGNEGVYSLSRHYFSSSYDDYVYNGCYIADSVYHDGQMRMFVKKQDDGTKKYGFVNGFGETAVPFVYTDKDKALNALKYFKNKPVPPQFGTGAYRTKLLITRRLRTYGLYDIVPSDDWDY